MPWKVKIFKTFKWFKIGCMCYKEVPILLLKAVLQPLLHSSQSTDKIQNKLKLNSRRKQNWTSQELQSPSGPYWQLLQISDIWLRKDCRKLHSQNESWDPKHKTSTANIPVWYKWVKKRCSPIISANWQKQSPILAPVKRGFIIIPLSRHLPTGGQQSNQNSCT